MEIYFILTWFITHAAFIRFAHYDSFRSYIVMPLYVHHSIENVLCDSLRASRY
jgi:hypothetical protein